MIASVTIGVSIFLVFMGDTLIGAAIGASILIALILTQMGKMFFEGRGVVDEEEDDQLEDLNLVTKVEYCARIVPLSLLLMTLACICTISINSEALHVDQMKNATATGCDHML